MQILDRDEFLAQQGVEFSASDYCLDKSKGNRQLKTEKGRKRFEKECLIAEQQYQEERNKAIKEYEEMVAKGLVRPRTSIERCILRANGHPDNESTQAARRMCEKRGINWKVNNSV